MLEPITDGLWGLDGRVSMPGGVRFPLRMTVVRLPDRGLLLHSPVEVSEEQSAAIDALGEVRVVVAPSLLHHLHVGPAVARWPDARLLGAPGLAEKRPDLPFRGVLPDDADESWASALRPILLRGAPSVSEVVFVHRPTATLICTDLLFHMRADDLPTRLLLGLVGCQGRLAASRSWRWVFARDTDLLRASVAEVLSEPIRRVVPAHGAVAEVDRAALIEAFGWLAA